MSENRDADCLDDACGIGTGARSVKVEIRPHSCEFRQSILADTPVINHRINRRIPSVIAVVSFAAICCTSVAASAQASAGTVLPRGPLAVTVDSIIELRAKQGFTGSALLSVDGATTLLKGYGLANKARSTPFGPATVVQIGSNTKDFTAIAILQLVERNQLKLTDSIASIWRAVPNDKRGVTIRQLLNHRAGFAQNGGDDFAPVARPDMVDAALASKLMFVPGTKESYSNVGFSLLAAIVELKSGVTFDEYVAKNILEPAKLKNTGLLLPGFEESRLAHGYRRDGSDYGTMISRPHAPNGPFWNLRGNGGMLSTLEDMLAFYEAVYADRLVGHSLRVLQFQDEPTSLAGSDGINFFFFVRIPQRKIAFLMSSTNEAVPGPSVFRPIRQMLEGGRGSGADAGWRLVKTVTGLATTPRGKAVSEWLEAYNSGDTAQLRKVLLAMAPNSADQRTIGQRITAMLERRKRSGPLTPFGVMESATGIGVRVRTGSNARLQYTFDLDANPVRIRQIRLEDLDD